MYGLRMFIISLNIKFEVRNSKHKCRAAAMFSYSLQRNLYPNKYCTIFEDLLQLDVKWW
jgi:hypothetical protein